MENNQQQHPPDGSRMDRFERGLEHLLATQARHEASAETRFQQVEARMDRLNEALVRLVGVVDQLAETQRTHGEETDRRFRDTADRFRDTDERLNTLIKTVDEMIRRRPPERPSD